MSEIKEKSRRPRAFAGPGEVREALKLALGTQNRKTRAKQVLLVLRLRTGFAVSPELAAEAVKGLCSPSVDEGTRFMVVTEALLSPRSSDLLNQVAGELVRRVRQQTGYFSLLEAAGPNGIGWEDLAQWLAAALRTPSDQSGKRKAPSAEALRLVLTAILPDFPREHFVDSALEMIRRASPYPDPRPTKGTVRPYDVLRDFGQAVVALLKREQLSHRNLKLALSLITPLENSRRKAIEHLSTARYERESSKREAAALKDRVATLESQVNQLERARAELTAQVESVRKELTEERLRYEELDRHWSEVSRGERAQALFEVKRNLEHETTEILLSLEREAPNVPMAIDRVRNIQEILALIGSAS